MCIGGRIFRLNREDGMGRVFEGAKDTGSSASSVRSEGLRSKSLSLFGSYEPSPATPKLVGCLRALLPGLRLLQARAGQYVKHTFKVGS